jgi:hypothetical protein
MALISTLCASWWSFIVPVLVNLWRLSASQPHPAADCGGWPLFNQPGVVVAAEQPLPGGWTR